MSEKKLLERNRLRTMYLALRHAREDKDTEEIDALTEQLDHVRLNLFNTVSPMYDEPDLSDTDVDLILSLSEFVLTYESLVALLINISDQKGMHEAITQARKYSHFIAHRNDEVTDPLRSEVQAFMIENHDLFDNLEVNSNIGAQGLSGDLRVKKEILEHVMDTKYTEREIGVITEVEAPTWCKCEELATYYCKHSKEELEDAQELISSRMDEIDKAYEDANVEELGVVRAQPRGETRHVSVGAGYNNDNDDDDDENTLDYVENDDNNDHEEEEYIHMDEENATGLKITQLISVEDPRQDEPMDIEPDNFIVPPNPPCGHTRKRNSCHQQSNCPARGHNRPAKGCATA